MFSLSMGGNSIRTTLASSLASSAAGVSATVASAATAGSSGLASVAYWEKDVCDGFKKKESEWIKHTGAASSTLGASAGAVTASWAGAVRVSAGLESLAVEVGSADIINARNAKELGQRE